MSMSSVKLGHESLAQQIKALQAASEGDMGRRRKRLGIGRGIEHHLGSWRCCFRTDQPLLDLGEGRNVRKFFVSLQNTAFK